MIYVQYNLISKFQSYKNFLFGFYIFLKNIIIKDIIVFDDCFILEIESLKLFPIAKMCHKRAAHAIVFVDGKIMVIGGIGEDCEILDSCEVYSVEDDEWTELAPLNVPSMNSCVCSFDDRYLFKIGGKLSENELCNNIER